VRGHRTRPWPAQRWNLPSQLHSYWVCAVRAFVLLLCSLRSMFVRGSFPAAARQRKVTAQYRSLIGKYLVSKWVIAFARLDSLSRFDPLNAP
jgi:hypothetical protein